MGLSRRRFLGLGALTVAVGHGSALTGCGDVAAGDALQLRGWDFASDLVRNNLERFEQLNQDGLQVEFTAVDDGDYVSSTGDALTNSGDLDVLYIPEDALVPWVRAGLLEPLDDLDGIDDLYDQMYVGSTSVMTYDKEPYGLPYYSDVICLIYNAELLEKAGFTEPPNSLEGMAKQAEAIKAEGFAEYPIGLSALQTGSWWGWWWALLFASDAQLFDERMVPMMADSEPVARNILTWLSGAVTERAIIDPAAPKIGPDVVDQAFIDGDHAFVLTARHSARMYNDKQRSPIAGKAVMAMVPSLDGATQGTVSYTQMYGLAASSTRKRSSHALLKYLGGLDHTGDPYTARYWFKHHGLGFAFRDLVYDSDIRAELTTFARPDIYAQLAEVAWPRRIIEVPWYADYESASQKAIADLLTGSLTPEEAVQQMADTAVSLADEYEPDS